MKNLKQRRDKDLEITTGGDWQLVSKIKLLSLNSNHVIPCSISPSIKQINDVMDLVLVYFFSESSVPEGNSTTVA